METKKITKVHFIASGLLWLLGILTFLLGQFSTLELYSLTGFAFVGWFWITVGIELFALGTVHLEQDANIKKKYFIRNLILILLNIAFFVIGTRFV